MNDQQRPMREARPMRDQRPTREERPFRNDSAASPMHDESSAPAQQHAQDGNEADGGYDTQNSQLTGILYLNLGKRDGVRVGEVARLVRESAELSREEVGRIRVRDRYTFVDVPEARVDEIIAKLAGQKLNDKDLAPERAKSSGTGK